MECTHNRHHAQILENNQDTVIEDGELNIIHSLKGLGKCCVCQKEREIMAHCCEKQAVNYASYIK